MIDFKEAHRRAEKMVDCVCGECTTVPYLWVVQPIYEQLLAMGDENYLMVPHEAQNLGRMIAGMAQRLDQTYEALGFATVQARENLDLAERGLELADKASTQLLRIYVGAGIIGIAVLGALVSSLVF